MARRKVKTAVASFHTTTDVLAFKQAVSEGLRGRLCAHPAAAFRGLRQAWLEPRGCGGAADSLAQRSGIELEQCRRARAVNLACLYITRRKGVPSHMRARPCVRGFCAGRRVRLGGYRFPGAVSRRSAFAGRGLPDGERWPWRTLPSPLSLSRRACPAVAPSAVARLLPLAYNRSKRRQAAFATMKKGASCRSSPIRVYEFSKDNKLAPRPSPARCCSSTHAGLLQQPHSR